MPDNTTQPVETDVDDFVNAVEHPGRRQDALLILEMMRRVTGTEPCMWGATLVGFGRYHYRYESGREGHSFRLGFSPRQAKMVVYIMPYTDVFDVCVSEVPQEDGPAGVAAHSTARLPATIELASGSRAGGEE